MRTINEIMKELEQAEAVEKERLNKEHVRGCVESSGKCSDCLHNHAYHRLTPSDWCPTCEMCGLAPEHPWRLVTDRVALRLGPSFDDQIFRDLCKDCGKRVAQMFKDAK